MRIAVAKRRRRFADGRLVVRLRKSAPRIILGPINRNLKCENGQGVTCAWIYPEIRAGMQLGG